MYEPAVIFLIVSDSSDNPAFFCHANGKHLWRECGGRPKQHSELARVIKVRQPANSSPHLGLIADADGCIKRIWYEARPDFCMDDCRSLLWGGRGGETGLEGPDATDCCERWGVAQAVEGRDAHERLATNAGSAV